MTRRNHYGAAFTQRSYSDILTQPVPPEVADTISMNYIMMAEWAYQYSVRLSYDSPYAKLPAQRRKNEEAAFAVITMMLHTNLTTPTEDIITTMHLERDAYRQKAAVPTNSEKEQLRLDAYLVVFNMFCGLYPRH